LDFAHALKCCLSLEPSLRAKRSNPFHSLWKYGLLGRYRSSQ
jgi:hypothetical protein